MIIIQVLSIMSKIKNIIKLFIPNKLLKLKRNYVLDKQREKFHYGCKELIFKIDDILHENNIPFWLTYGTLLGAYREHDFIAHDYDMDIAIDIKYMNKIKPIMLEHGLKLMNEVHFGGWESPQNVEYRFEYNGAYVDFDFYVIEDDNAYTYNPLFVDGVEYKKGQRSPVIAERIDNPFNGLKRYSFLGRDFNIPENTEEYLVANYGPSWKTPIKDYDYHAVASNITALLQEEFPSYIMIY